MTISTHGTAFTSYDVKANHKTKEEISQEKVSFDETIKQTHQVEDVVYHTTTQADDAKPTTFVDPVTKKYVIASLENKTLDKLKEKFGTDDIIQKEDGSVRLTGNAEAFVSGWFADIAYKREFLTADANSDGQLSEDEYDNTKNNFGINNFHITEGSEKLLLSSEEITHSYVEASDDIYYRNYREFDIATSLDDELNTTLQGDINLDGKMSLDEAYSTNGNDAKDVVLRHLEEWNLPTQQSDTDTSSFDFMLNFILDVFSTKDGKEQEEIIDELMFKLNELDTYEEEEIKEFETLHSQDYFNQLLNLKEKKDEKVEIYS
jgi:hypothetical protein